MLFRRGLVRGSWVGVGLLVATSAAAPAALAADDGVDPDPLVSGTQQLPGAGPTSAGALDTGTPADEAPAAGPTDAGVVPPTLDAGTPAVAAAGPSDSLGDDGGDPDESDDDGDGADAPAGMHTLEGFFGSGKELVIDVLLPADGMPDDLDLSATRFTLSNDAGESYECSLDSDGRCTFSAFFLDGDAVPPGTYRLTQTGHAPGLEAVPGTGTVELCNSGLSIMSSCAWTIPLPVHNTSSFSHGVVTTVRDAAGRPVVGAHYSLGGPDYPRTVPPVVVPPVVVSPVEDPEENAPPADDLATAVSAGSDGGTTTGLPPVSAGSPAVQAAAPASTRAVQATSDADGVLRFPGWFAAGSDYTLTPVTADGRPTGASSPLTLVKPASSGQAAELTPLVVPSADEPTSVTSPAPVPVPAPVLDRFSRRATSGSSAWIRSATHAT